MTSVNLFDRSSQPYVGCGIAVNYTLFAGDAFGSQGFFVGFQAADLRGELGFDLVEKLDFLIELLNTLLLLFKSVWYFD